MLLLHIIIKCNFLPPQNVLVVIMHSRDVTRKFGLLLSNFTETISFKNMLHWQSGISIVISSFLLYFQKYCENSLFPRWPDFYSVCFHQSNIMNRSKKILMTNLLSCFGYKSFVSYRNVQRNGSPSSTKKYKKWFTHKFYSKFRLFDCSHRWYLFLCLSTTIQRL